MTTPSPQPVPPPPVPGIGSTASTVSPYREPPRRGPRLGWLAAWALSLVLAFLLGLGTRPQSAVTAASPSPVATASARPTRDPQVTQLLRSLPRRDPADPTAKGRPDAPVVLIEWSDYRCPFCAVWARRTLPALERHVADGTLRIEYRDLPMFGEQSVNVAVAARAAGRQGRFWEYYRAVFAAAPQSGHPEIGPNEIQGFARAAGVPDLARFTADLADPELRAKVEADATQAQQLGITGTPFFVVGTQIINGAQPTEAFEQAVEAAKRD